MKLKTNVLYSAKMIEDRVSSLAQQIQQSYPKDEKPIICLCVLRGAVLFFADLMKKMDDERIRFDFITLSSYESTSTTGNIKLVQDLRSDVKDAHVLIVEDIIDSGYTLRYLKDYFADKQASDVKVVTLLDKPMARKVDIKPDFTAFILERPAFIVGYGLDLDQKYRNIDCIMEVIE